jgi:hypothetical protein
MKRDLTLMVNDLAMVLLSTFGVDNPPPSNLENFIELTRLDSHKPEVTYLAYVTHPIWKPFLQSILTGEAKLTTRDFLKNMNKESIIATQERLMHD